jgi:site-specific recombinase XerD
MERFWELNKTLPNRENQEIVNDFLLNLKLANRSEETISAYKAFLIRFFCNVEISYSSMSSEKILEWFLANYSHTKESTYKRYLSILSSFYNYCVQESLIERTPIKKRWFPRLPRPVPKYLGKADIAKIRQESERVSLRDQALIEFLLTSGCRVAEVHRLNIQDLDFENRTAQVLGKGKKYRQIHFSEKCAVLLEKYLKTRKGKIESSLFITARKEYRRLSIRGIQAVIRKIGKNAGLSTSCHPHRFRHTFATELLAKGAELSFISDELGHADLATTQIYARLPNQAIVSQYRKFMG